MDAVFLKLLNMSIAAGWLVLAVIVLRLFLKKAPRALHCILWALVAFRLICPFSFESALSLIPSAEPVPPEIMYTSTPEIHSGIPAVNNAVNPIISGTREPGIGTSVHPVQLAVAVASYVWAVGAAALLIYAFISYLRIRAKVKTAVRSEHGVMLSENVGSPFILGIIKPRIYLPFGMGEQQAAHVIAHERAHLERHDHLWKPLGFALLAVYWFNPLMWAAYILLCRDIELACDEKVIKKMGVSEKKAYSEALLSCSIPRRMVAACPLAFGEVGVKKRIKNVLNYKKPAFWIIAAAVIASVVLAVCFLTNPHDPSAVRDKLQSSSCDTISIQVVNMHDFAESGIIEITDTGIINSVITELHDAEYRKPLRKIKEAPDNLAADIALMSGGESFMRILMLSSDSTENEFEIHVFTDGDQFAVSNPLKISDSILAIIESSGTTDETNSGKLTLDDVIRLSENGDALTWSDFEQYDYIETGSGLYIRLYEIDDMFSLNIGGSTTELDPMYILLSSNFTPDALIDIRTGGVEAFIKEQRAIREEHLKNNDPLPVDFPIGFMFSSGAGAWGTSLQLYPDGSFVGSFSDSNMGETGKGYPNGTSYSCEFSGRFENIKKVDEYSYSMTLAELSQTGKEGDAYISDGIRFVTSYPYGVTGGEKFTLYLPETPADAMPEYFVNWSPNRSILKSGELKTLSCYGLCNISAGTGFFSTSNVTGMREEVTMESFLSNISGSDIGHIEWLNHRRQTPDEIADVLRDAADDRVVREPMTMNGSSTDIFWSLYLFIGDDMSSGNELALFAGLEEGFVEIVGGDNLPQERITVRNKALYDIVRHSRDYDEIIDKTAFKKFEKILTAQMELGFSHMSDNPSNFTGYELTRFNRVWRYENEGGISTVELYDFDYALLSDSVETIGWAGGMYLDGKLRVQGFNGGGQFAVQYVNGKVAATAFMGNDFYYTPDDIDNAEWAKERLNSALCGLSQSEIDEMNKFLESVVRDEEDIITGVNPISCFFTSYYDDVRELDFEEFMRYFPGGTSASDSEFEALKSVEVWPFDWVEKREDMPVPISKYPAKLVNSVLKEYAGITTADLDTSGVAYLEEYDAYYNYTSDFGPGMFSCTRGERHGDTLRLFHDGEGWCSVLTLRESGNSYKIISFTGREVTE